MNCPKCASENIKVSLIIDEIHTYCTDCGTIIQEGDYVNNKV